MKYFFFIDLQYENRMFAIQEKLSLSKIAYTHIISHLSIIRVV